MSEGVVERGARAARRQADPLRARAVGPWFAVLAPAFAWGAHVAVGDLLYELGCAAGMRRTDILALSLRAWGLIQTGAFLAITAIAGLIALRSWRRVRGLEDGTALKRAQALALGGMASALIFGLIIAFAFVPQLWLSATCGTSL